MQRQALDWDALVATQAALAIVPPVLRDEARLHAFAQGDTLFRAGEPVKRIFVVASGEVRLLRRARGGSEVVLQRARAFVAEASLDSHSYHCDAVAATAASVVSFPAAAFRAALESDPAFARAWQSQLAREVRRLRAQVERLCLKGAPERIAHYIQSEGADGALTLTQSRMAWAAELGITHESLYRSLRAMQERGVLHIEGATLRLRQA